ncbi:MAG: glycosyltransferase family 4 protein, partial [Terrimicrobiaceae bacterium]|nr:glycosyltransferase family 4 protein [Terrimicrobiaceae bacterium]
LVLLSDGPFAEMARERGILTTILPLQGLVGAVTKNSGLFGWARALACLPAGLAAIRKACRGSRLVYFNTPKAAVLGAAANLLSGRKSVLHLHDLLEQGHFSRANIECLVAAANRCDAVIANSEAVARQFRERGGRVTVHVIPNGFDTEFWTRHREVGGLRRELEPQGRPVVAVFGRLSPWKGQHVALEAVARLPQAALWVVGEAFYTAEDMSYAAALRQRAEAADLAGRVRFLGHRSDIPELMRAADVVVHCSVAAEPFGRVIVEAMLSGRPVVASAAGGPLEILEQDATGWLAPPGDPAKLVEILQSILSSPQRAEEVARKACETALRRYSLPSVLGKIREVLTPLLE